MTSQEFTPLHILHVSGVLILLAFTFLAFAGAPETRRTVLSWAGVGSLLVLLTGLRMWQAQFNFVMAGWILIKLLCWIGVSALAGLGYRRRGRAGTLATVALLLSILAVVMVYSKPF